MKLRSVKATLRETKSLNVAFTDLRQAGTLWRLGHPVLLGWVCWGVRP